MLFLGTKSVRDLLLDMVCDETPFLTGAAHSGIVTGVRKVWSLVSEAVSEKCHQYPQYKLVLTGN